MSGGGFGSGGLTTTSGGGGFGSTSSTTYQQRDGGSGGDPQGTQQETIALRRTCHRREIDTQPERGFEHVRERLVPLRAATRLHRHRVSEEIYHVVAGCGRMTLGDVSLTLALGDTVLIPPGTPHRLENTGDQPLRVLCCCSPPYAHADTDLL